MNNDFVLSEKIAFGLDGFKTKDVKEFIRILKEEDYYKLAIWLHTTYENLSLEEGWETQEECKVMFDNLPQKNKNVMLKLACALIEKYNNKADKFAGKDLI
jgi:hypothetical protein